MNKHMVLFLDIETVPEKDFDDLPEDGVAAFRKRFDTKIDLRFRQLKDEYLENNKAAKVFPEEMLKAYDSFSKIATMEVYNGEASLLAEYCKIACVSVGIVGNDGNLKIVTLVGENEHTILTSLAKSLQHAPSSEHSQLPPKPRFDFLCAHNGKEFDFPILARRFMANRLAIPAVLDNRFKKPWEGSFLDTMEMWKMSSYRHNSSLPMLAYCLGLPSPKTDMDGSMVRMVFQNGEYERLARYCEGDVVTLVNAYLIMMNEPPIPVENIIYASRK